MLIAFKSRFDRVKAWVIKHDRHLSSITLFTGFILDNLTLRRIDRISDVLILVTYLCIAGLSIFLYHREAGHGKFGRMLLKIQVFLPLTLQFAFGALFSGFLVFYGRSASFAVSWPYIFILAALLIGNELFRKHYSRLSFQISIYFLTIFSFTIFYIPILLNRIGAGTFILSGLVSLAILYFYLAFLWRFASVGNESLKYIALGVIAIFVLINVSYFTNILPPIPLALKDAGIYHFIAKEGDGYLLKGEKPRHFEYLRKWQVVHAVAGESLYAYSSVFAPTNLVSDVTHEWQKYNESARTWETESRISFSIKGGRTEGYKGYSVKSTFSEGLWRVNILTARGQLIGRTNFRVENVLIPPELETQKII